MVHAEMKLHLQPGWRRCEDHRRNPSIQEADPRAQYEHLLRIPQAARLLDRLREALHHPEGSAEDPLYHDSRALRKLPGIQEDV